MVSDHDYNQSWSETVEPDAPVQQRPRRLNHLFRSLRRLLRGWCKEELRLTRGRWLSPAVGAGAILLTGGLLAIDAVVLLRNLVREREARVRESTSILTATISGVERTALDWGHWDSLYAWMQGRNPSFLATDVETTPLFDEGGLLLIADPRGQRRLIYGRKGHDHPSHQALFPCLQQHLGRLPTVVSRISLLCRSGDGILYIGVATPITNSTESAPSLGTLVMFEPLLKPTYGAAFNRPLQWLIAGMRMVDPPREGVPPFIAATPAGPATPLAATRPAPGERWQPLALNRPLFSSTGSAIGLRVEPFLPALLRELAGDLLLALSGIGAALAVRILLLNERRRQRLQQRRSELGSNRRIRRASKDLDRLLARFGVSGSSLTGEERVLARLIDAPAVVAGSPSVGPSMERKLEGLANRFQHFLDRAKHLALLDPLTKLPNRRYFIEQMQMMVESRRSDQKRFAILFVDIDKFKNINDSYGHAIGDAALILVAESLRSGTRSSDFLGRYGGDEFAILIELDGSESAHDSDQIQIVERYAHRIVAPFESSVEIGGFRLDLSISVGISLIDRINPNLEVAMRNSDIAMYRAKQNTNTRIAVFSEEDESAHLDSYKLYVDLMQSIRDRHFKVLFQPIFDQRCQVHSLEALSRWQHPSLGTIGPDVFLDLAERYRQMNTLSDELIGLAMMAYHDLYRAGQAFRLSLNLPPSKLSDPHLVSDLLRQLDTHGIPADRLTIELTERSVLRPHANVSTNLDGLRACGIAISLDDFGTGYSSLSLLSSLKPDEVKIDKSFVMAMQRDAVARQIVSMIADMAPRLGMRVVAEGVEDSDTLAQLRELGICFFQGFLFSRPCSVEALRSSPLLAIGDIDGLGHPV